MDWTKFTFHAFTTINVLLALFVAYRSIRYCIYHIKGYRRLGAWLAVLSCTWYIVNAFNLLLAPEQNIMKMYGTDMFAITINQCVLFLAAVFLLNRNPAPVIDPDDAQEILDRFERTTCEFSNKYRELMVITHAK